MFRTGRCNLTAARVAILIPRLRQGPVPKKEKWHYWTGHKWETRRLTVTALSAAEVVEVKSC